MPDEIDNISFRFFRLFAHYEWALKQMGYGKAARNGTAEANWDKFAKDFGGALMESEDQHVVEAREYILAIPPKREMWVNGRTSWEASPAERRCARTLFIHIRRVRNNLYHGGKFYDGHWFDEERSVELIKRSLLLLEYLRSTTEGLHAIRGEAH